MVKIGKKKLKLKSGKIITFKSEAARERYEKVARAYAHGWKGPKGGRRRTTRRSKRYCTC